VELDRKSIERSDFPLVRRGYDPSAVGAHLRELAQAAQELSQRVASAGVEPSLGSAAATRVRSILEAAQTTAAEIALEAQREAQSTRDQAAAELERARGNVDALARAATALLAQVRSLDGEVSALAQSLRPEEPSPAVPANEPELELELDPEPDPEPELEPELEPEPASDLDRASSSASSAEHATPSRQRSEDLDGARLVALNMALSGEPREQADRYLADSFELSDRAKLLDEVYAAIEG